MKVKISVIDREDCILDAEVGVYDEEDRKELIEFIKSGIQAYEDYSFEKGVDLINKNSYKLKYNENYLNIPTHYQPHGIIKNEPVKTIQYMFSDDAYKGFLVGNIIKYISRYDMKNGIEDLEKAKKYIDMLEQEYRK